ncbi:uncharacterized protein CDV56_107012 [Aspergillus thermomutatus]|uniref:Uncharacterized protein n=1 Tax=Aspergillus thermomutatus TaxID=41047 RepID=A0A397HG10_ASPTH|nr:uncharacterized protein CDV56_107012 [Aspergillus thermomutatus]RHZ61809.1 hypothetical protein CDV56_107012 [Aspergillus thermomutatus]
MTFQNDHYPLLPNDTLQQIPLEDMAFPEDHNSTYYIYRERNDHMLITTTQQPKTEKERRKKQKEDPSSVQDPNGYFVHRPYLSFAHPPRTLRYGGSKDGRTICLIRSYSFWRRWQLQFGTELGDAIDPRGVVQWQSRTNADNSVKADGDLKGYRVRSWRLWGESGKQYHREVNTKRKQGLFAEDDATDHRPLRATEAVQLTWRAPFSKRTREYAFRYEGVDFVWKGTKDLPGDSKLARRLMPVHHLKLVAIMPCKVADEAEEVAVACFVCSAEEDEYGTLVIQDSKLCKMLGISEMPQDMALARAEDLSPARVHDTIMATAVCMIIGEWQKRKTAVSLVFALLFAGATSGANK